MSQINTAWQLMQAEISRQAGRIISPAMVSVVAGVAVFVLSMPVGADEKTAPDAASGHAPEMMLRRTIDHNGIEREYFVHVPQGHSGNLPVVIAVHGYTSTATGFAASHGPNRHADEHGYIAVYPQGSHFLADDGQGGSYRVTSWNDLAANLGPQDKGPHCVADADRYACPVECGECNRCAWTSCYDDVGFIEKMLDAV